jgi:NAD(P)H-hydrate repair Nnr-like enzyme with NAD(P)H-hydrate epimerase domain
LVDPYQLQGDAATAYQYALQEVVLLEPYRPGVLASLTSGVVVDALLGTGVQGQVRDDYATAINEMNACALPIFRWIFLPASMRIPEPYWARLCARVRLWRLSAATLAC